MSERRYIIGIICRLRIGEEALQLLFIDRKFIRPRELDKEPDLINSPLRILDEQLFKSRSIHNLTRLRKKLFTSGTFKRFDVSLESLVRIGKPDHIDSPFISVLKDSPKADP